MTTTEKLLPCPFCGGDNLIKDEPSTQLRTQYVECQDCGCSFAASLWNTRADLTPVSAEDLQKVLDALKQAKLTFLQFRRAGSDVSDEIITINDALLILDRIAKAVG